jgi:hypothetical protein
MTVIINGDTGISAPGPSIIETSTTDAALRITQTGTGNALLVEDSSNPDSTPFVIDYNGNVAIGATTTTEKLKVVGTTSVVGTAYSPNINLTDAATIAWDTSLGQVATFTFVSSNRTMGAPTNLINGAFYALAVIQNSGSNTLSWNSVFKWINGAAPVLSTAAGAKDYFVFRSDGTNLYQQGIAQAVA